MTNDTIYAIPVKRIDGVQTTLNDFRGKVLLIINVASKCGLTPQYAGLEALYQAKQAQGLEILGFPANNFKEQEPGSDAEIQQFCTLNYDVHFPLFSKISVVGGDQHPLYRHLTAAAPEAIGEGPMRERLRGSILGYYRDDLYLVPPSGRGGGNDDTDDSLGNLIP